MTTTILWLLLIWGVCYISFFIFYFLYHRPAMAKARFLGTIYLSTEDVAELLDVSQATILRMIHKGKLPAVRRGRCYRIPFKGLEEYLKYDQD